MPVTHAFQGVVVDCPHVEGGSVPIFGAISEEISECVAKLPACANDEDGGGRHGGGVSQLRVVAVFVGNFGLVEADGPVDHVEVDEVVFRVWVPVVVDEVGIDGAVDLCLESIGDAAGHKHCNAGVNGVRVGLPVGGASFS